MAGKEIFASSPSDSSGCESSDEGVQEVRSDPRATTREPYRAQPPWSSSASSFSQKAAVHLFELFDLSEEEAGYGDEEEVRTTEVTLHHTVSTVLDTNQNERCTMKGAGGPKDEDEEVITLLLGDGRSTTEDSREVEACFPCRRCPCAKGLAKEERVMRWLLLCGFFFCIPWAVAMYMGLCTSRKNHKGLRQIGRLAALLWSLAWTLLVTVCVVVSVILIRVTHILSEKTYGTVAFVGLMPAKTWSDADLLTHAYKLGFDAVAISPPGIGATTNITNLKDSFYNDENFLNQVLESCLDIRLSSTVVVSHSNIITRQYFFPLLMVMMRASQNTGLLGFVLFDSYAGEEWITEVNPALNDHLFYEPKTRNYRYVGNRRLSENVPGNRASPTKQGDPFSAEDSKSPTTSVFSPVGPQPATFLPPSASEANKHPARLLQAVNCLAAEFDADNEDTWDDMELRTLGPYQFFPGKYKVPGWGMKQAELLATPLDAPPDNKSSLLDVLSSTGAGILSGLSGSENTVDRVVEEARLVPSRRTPAEYFDPLKEALTDILTEIKDKIDLGNYHPERILVTFRDDRKTAYTKARVKTTLIDPSTIYCLQDATTLTASTSLKKDVPNGSEQPNPLARRQLLRPTAVTFGVDSSGQPDGSRTQVNNSSLRGGASHRTSIAPRTANMASTGFYEENVFATNGGPAEQIEYLGEVVIPVDPKRFSPDEKQKLLEAYAIRDHLRAQERARRGSQSQRGRTPRV